MDPPTADEITRILPTGGTVHVLGGVGAGSTTVAASLTKLGFKVNRLEGYRPLRHCGGCGQEHARSQQGAPHPGDRLP